MLVLIAGETITMSATEVAEGAIATVVRENSKGGRGEQIQARPVSDFYLPGETRQVCFLKVDVEGYEIHAIRSARLPFT